MNTESESQEHAASPQNGDSTSAQASASAAPGSVPGGSVAPGQASTAPGAADASAESPEAEIAKLRDRLLRTAADYDNYRKRSRRDIAEAERRVQEDLLRSLLPTFDNLERAALHAGSAADVKALSDGIKLVLRQFQDTLGGLGIERVAAVGKPFDPAEHEAVQHVQTDQAPPGVVLQELQAGYRWQGRLMRPALVVVAKSGAAPSAGDGRA
ncbi:MAG TPA: nucleotide exchange factor GrpE [Polyangiaceae bacterium]|nr:nucleotide exchange factor GrpE [Polyangiaceae bacterium]